MKSASMKVMVCLVVIGLLAAQVECGMWDFFIRRMDKNNDNKLGTTQELNALRRSLMKRGKTSAEVDSLIDTHDINHDNAIDAGEYGQIRSAIL